MPRQIKSGYLLHYKSKFFIAFNHNNVRIALHIFSYLCTLFNTASSVAPRITLCRRMQGLHPELLRLWHWQPDTLTTRLVLIHSRLALIHSQLALIHWNPFESRDFIPLQKQLWCSQDSWVAWRLYEIFFRGFFSTGNFEAPFTNRFNIVWRAYTFSAYWNKLIKKMWQRDVSRVTKGPWICIM